MARRANVTWMDKACFRAGCPSGSRDPDDPAVIQAVADAEALIGSLPPVFVQPMVHAGTTLLKDDKVILRLVWVSCWENPFHNLLVITLSGNGRAKVAGTRKEVRTLDLEDVPVEKLSADKSIANFIGRLSMPDWQHIA